MNISKLLFQNALSEKPKILGQGSLTLAAPIKEQKEYRKVSDAIANNYSLQARHLTTSHIYEATKYGEFQQSQKALALLVLIQGIC